MRALLSATLIAGLLLGAAIPAAMARPAQRCTAPGGMTRFKVALPQTARAIRRGEALIIVAIGSSSTRGVGASDQAHTYPAVFAEELRRRWPRLAVTVVNAGVGGETAAQGSADRRFRIEKSRQPLVNKAILLARKMFPFCSHSLDKRVQLQPIQFS